MTSIHPDTIMPSSLDYIPLTTDNLMKKAQLDSTTSIPPAVLVERYCQDMMTVSPNSVSAPMKRRKQRSTSSSSHKIRPSSQRRQSSSIKSSTSTTTRDNTVMESPRLLPFPYHNDSLFLPTVEQHRRMERAKSVASIRSSSSFGNHPQPFGSNLASSARSSAAFSFSLPPPPSPKRQRSAPSALSRCPKTIEPRPFCEVSMPSPVPPAIQYQEKRDQQHLTTTASSPESLPSRPTKSSSSTLSHSWLRKVWKLLKKSSLQHRLSSSTKAMASVVS